MDATARDALPDSAFAFPEVRTEPLVDASHVRSAVSRFMRVADEQRDRAWARSTRAASVHGVDLSESSWHDLT